MGDHGGILTAVKYFHGNAKTRYLLYSTDEGESWSQAPFYKEEIRLYGLMTEPGENTTVFTMFGSAPAIHQWIIIKVDLRGVFSYNCSKVSGVLKLARIYRWYTDDFFVWAFRGINFVFVE